jgi:tetratricopeptide (TPR) repeat protein
VDREYIAHCRAQGFYPGVYYPHNMHFVWFSASVEGRSDLAVDAAKTAAEFAVDALCGKADVVEAPRFRFLPQLTQVRFGQWKAALKTPEPAATPDFVFDRGMWHYNRGLALIGLNRADEAATHLAALEKILTGDESKLLQNYFFPATAALTIAKHHLAGRLAGAKNDNNAMIAELEKAIAVQDTLPYMEPPYWDYPMRQTLGAALIETGDYTRAEQAFRDSLKEFPRNGRSLFGLSESLRRQNKVDAAASVQREFTEAWKHADVKPDLNWF